MRKEECFYLGKITKKFSFKGEVLAYLDTDEPHRYQNMESVFVEQSKTLIPFFIQKSSIHKNTHLRIKFEEVDSEAQADALLGCDLYLPLSKLPKLSGKKFYFHEIVDFALVDKNQGVVGRILGVNDTAAQLFFEIERQSQTYLIPILDAFIQKIDRSEKQFHVDLPKGVLDVLSLIN